MERLLEPGLSPQFENDRKAPTCDQANFMKGTLWKRAFKY